VENAPGFQFSVLWAEIAPAASTNAFPKVKGEYRVLVDATNERTGGFRKGDAL
jgi:tyrosinase